MARYMLSVHSVEGDVREPPTPEQMAHNWQQLQIVEAEMNSTGAWVFSARLHGPDTATVVRVANGDASKALPHGPSVAEALSANETDQSDLPLEPKVGVSI